MQFMLKSYKSGNTVRGKCTLTLYQASVCCSFFFTPLGLFLHHKFKTQDV